MEITELFFADIITCPIAALDLFLCRGVTEKTRSVDNYRLRPFLSQFEQLDEIQPHHVDEWIESLKENLNFVSRQSYSESLKIYFNWCVRDPRVRLFVSPASHLRVKRRRSARSKAANEQDIQKLLALLQDQLPEMAAARDLLALRLYYESGNRLKEVGSLTMKAMWEALRTGRLNSKGILIHTVYSDEGKKGSVPIRFTEHTAAVFRIWEEVRPPGGTKVFVSIKHTRAAVAVNPAALSVMLVRRCQEVGVQPFRTHAIRHLKGTKTTDLYGPTAAAAMLNISFEVAQMHYYDATEQAVLDATSA